MGVEGYVSAGDDGMFMGGEGVSGTIPKRPGGRRAG